MLNAKLVARNAAAKKAAEGRRWHLLTLFRAYGGAMTAADLDRLKLDAWRSGVARLVRDGKIARTGKGRWALDDGGLAVQGATC